MRYDAFHPGQVWLDTEKTEMYEKYLDPTLSAEERADDLLAKMSLDEKFAQTQCGFAERLLENGAAAILFFRPPPGSLFSARRLPYYAWQSIIITRPYSAYLPKTSGSSAFWPGWSDI